LPPIPVVKFFKDIFERNEKSSELEDVYQVHLNSFRDIKQLIEGIQKQVEALSNKTQVNLTHYEQVWGREEEEAFLLQ
jgi:hypothetical protein